MAWDDKLLSDINALRKKQLAEEGAKTPGESARPAPRPAPPPTPEAKPLDMAAIEAQIMASLTGSKPEPAPAEPEVYRPAAPVAEEPARRGEIVLEPIPDTVPEVSGEPPLALEESGAAQEETPAAEPERESIPVMQEPELVPAEPEAVAVAEPDEPEYEGIPESEPEAEPEPEPAPAPVKEIAREDIIHMAFDHEPLDRSSDEAKELFRKTAAALIPGYLGGMRLEDAVLRCDRQEMERCMEQADQDSLLVFLKFLCIEITFARNEKLLSEVETFVVEILRHRLNRA